MPGVRQVPEGSGEQRKMEGNGCVVIYAAPTTPALEEQVKVKVKFVPLPTPTPTPSKPRNNNKNWIIGKREEHCLFRGHGRVAEDRQWAGPLDLYGKEDAPALHESPSYG